MRLAVAFSLLALPVLPIIAQHRTVRIPAGSYEPLYAAAGEGRRSVAAFAIDAEPVTRRSFARFVAANPAWSASNIRTVFAERGYLAAWGASGNAEASRGDEPVTEVSWFAAKAYCASIGERLPTTDEWEYVAVADGTKRDASRDGRRTGKLLAWYSSRSGRSSRGIGHSTPNVYGVSDLNELVWEWTSDFNSVLVSDDSRELGAGGDERDHHLFCASAAIGATDASNYAAFLRYAFRSGLTARTVSRSLGFRCAVSI